jgi:hypothetical protein
MLDFVVRSARPIRLETADSMAKRTKLSNRRNSDTDCVRIVPAESQTLDGTLLSLSIFGRAPIHEVTVEGMPRRQKGVTANTNFVEGVFAILRVLGVPSTYPHPAYQTTRSRQ